MKSGDPVLVRYMDRIEAGTVVKVDVHNGRVAVDLENPAAHRRLWYDVDEVRGADD